MARENKLSNWLAAGNTRETFLMRWNLGGSDRENLIAGIGYANEGALYNSARNAGILTGGPVSTGSNNKDDGGDKASRKARVKGCLPVEVERWVRSGMMADWVYAGNSTDDYEEPEIITPELFLNHRPVKDETTAYRKILARIGGLESEAGKALRAWAGRPLTKSQELAERGPAKAMQDRATAQNILNNAQHATNEFRTVILAMLAHEFGEEWFDRKVGDGFIAFT